MKFLLTSLLFLSCLISCQQVQKVTDIVKKPTARELYERGFEDHDVAFLLWKRSYNEAKASRLNAILPFSMDAGITNQGRALGYRIDLSEGERLIVRTTATTDSLEIFADVFPFENDSVLAKEPSVRKEWRKDSLVFSVRQSGAYQLIVQPVMADTAYYHFKAYTLPSYSFPVAGKSNNAIQSFWGAARDGGKRSHKGVDIFANRGTPVVAAVDGTIRSTGNRGLGGKQVWLRDGLFGASLYYAHLDSIAVSRGERVKIGDTLGFVGNTGNAKYTKPHLHFGIYGTYGAVDPLPFIKIKKIPMKSIDTVAFEGTTRLKQNQLRTGASTKFDKLATLPKKNQLKLLGKSNDWYHVEVGDSLQGFMHQSLIIPKN